MAKPSLAQSCASLYQIHPEKLSKAHLKLEYSSALTYLIHFWFENFDDLTSSEDVFQVKEIIFLLADILDEAKLLLPKP